MRKRSKTISLTEFARRIGMDFTRVTKLNFKNLKGFVVERGRQRVDFDAFIEAYSMKNTLKRFGRTKGGRHDGSEGIRG